MAKFCTNCGKQNEDASAFCFNCGSPLQAPEAQPVVEEQTPVIEQTVETGEAKQEDIKSRLKIDKLLAMLKAYKSVLMIIGGAAIAAIVAVIVISAIFPSPKAVVKKYMKGFESENAKMIVSCMPDFFWDNDKDEKEEMIEELDDYLDYIDFDSFSFEIKKVKNFDDDEIEEWEEELESYESWYDEFDADDVKNFKSVKVKVTVKMDGEKDSTITEIILIKYKGQWKILDGGLY